MFSLLKITPLPPFKTEPVAAEYRIFPVNSICLDIDIKIDQFPHMEVKQFMVTEFFNMVTVHGETRLNSSPNSKKKRNFNISSIKGFKFSVSDDDWLEPMVLEHRERARMKGN